MMASRNKLLRPGYNQLDENGLIQLYQADHNAPLDARRHDWQPLPGEPAPAEFLDTVLENEVANTPRVKIVPCQFVTMAINLQAPNLPSILQRLLPPPANDPQGQFHYGAAYAYSSGGRVHFGFLYWKPSPGGVLNIQYTVTPDSHVLTSLAIFVHCLGKAGLNVRRGTPMPRGANLCGLSVVNDLHQLLHGPSPRDTDGTGHYDSTWWWGGGSDQGESDSNDSDQDDGDEPGQKRRRVED